MANKKPSDKPLTDREKQIYAELLKGIGNKEIAENLNLTERTVRGRLAQIYKKLNVATRYEAIAAQENKHKLPMGSI